jgi:RimJ/RimL family protein N-acetyltransferase
MQPITISRHIDATHINAILNHPEVRPWVAANNAPLDMTPFMESMIVLYGEYGGQVYHRLDAGLWEAHSAFLPKGRGQWALAATQASLKWMFARTDALEIVTRCPAGNVAAKALAKAIGGEHLFTHPEGWVKDGKPIPADVFSLTIQSWMKTSPLLVDRGRWFHARLGTEFARLGIQEPQHEDSETHDRYVGAACEMFFGGQPAKAAVFYNRVASIMNWHPVTVTSLNPLAVDIGSALLVMRGDDFFVPAPKQNAA